MPLISSKTIIASLSFLHLTLAFFLLTAPRTIDDQVLVWVLGEAMGLPLARGFDTQSPALGFVSMLLALIGLSDLMSLTMPEEVVLIYHWGSQAPLRAFFSMTVLFYSFLFGPSSPLFSAPSPRGMLAAPSKMNPGYHGATWGGEMLKNRVLFTFMFIEMFSWFWVWVSLREERYSLVMKLREREERSKRE